VKGPTGAVCAKVKKKKGRVRQWKGITETRPGSFFQPKLGGPECETRATEGVEGTVLKNQIKKGKKKKDLECEKEKVGKRAAGGGKKKAAKLGKPPFQGAVVLRPQEKQTHD